MLLVTNSLQPIQAFIVSISDHAIWVYGVIGLYFLITALCGFHPLVSLALLVSLMAPVIHELPALPIAIMLIIAGTSTVMFSPYNVSVSLLADLMKVNPYRITRWNIWFAGFISAWVSHVQRSSPSSLFIEKENPMSSLFYSLLF